MPFNFSGATGTGVSKRRRTRSFGASLDRQILSKTSRCRLFLYLKIPTPFGAGEHLVRVAAISRIEHFAERTHGLQIVGAELLRHEINLLHADAVLAANAAAHLH